MSNSEVLGKLENAKAYFKANKRFFKKFFRYYRIVNSGVYKAIETIASVLFVGCILIAGLALFDVIGDLKAEEIGLVVVIAVVSIVILFIRGMQEQKLDSMYRKYQVVNIVDNMLNYMCGLNYVFWNMKDINKLIKLASSDKTKDLKTVALEVKPKCKKLQFDVDRFNKQSEEAITRLNKRIQKENEKIASLLSKGTGGANTSVSGPTYASNARTAPVNSADDSKKRAEEERKRQLADYARQADWWEQEYRRLYAWDPNHYKTKDAEYNKNYFRRLSKGG